MFRIFVADQETTNHTEPKTKNQNASQYHHPPMAPMVTMALGGALETIPGTHDGGAPAGVAAGGLRGGVDDVEPKMVESVGRISYCMIFYVFQIYLTCWDHILRPIDLIEYTYIQIHKPVYKIIGYSSQFLEFNCSPNKPKRSYKLFKK